MNLAITSMLSSITVAIHNNIPDGSSSCFKLYLWLAKIKRHLIRCTLSVQTFCSVLACIFFLVTSIKVAEARNLFDTLFGDETDYDTDIERDIIKLQSEEDAGIDYFKRDTLTEGYGDGIDSAIAKNDRLLTPKKNGLYFSVGAGLVFPNSRCSVLFDALGQGTNTKKDDTIITITNAGNSRLAIPFSPIAMGAYGAFGKSIGMFRGEVQYLWNGSISVTSNRDESRHFLRTYIDSRLPDPLSQLSPDLRNLLVADNAFQVNVNASSIFANIYADILKDYSFAFPYVGAGLGFSSIRTTVPIASSSNLYLRSKTPLVEVDYKIPHNIDNNLAWNFGGGFVIKITEDFEVDIGYRFVQLGTFSTSNRGTKTITNLTSGDNKQSVTILNNDGTKYATIAPGGQLSTTYANLYYSSPMKLNTNNVTFMLRYRF